MLSFSQYAAIAVGAFYVFAGIVVLRAMVLDRLMDKLLAALNDPSAPVELWRSRALTGGGLLTLAGGVALVLLSPLAAAIFLLNSLWQGGYLLWAERALPPEDESEARGRQQTKNAFVVYLAATAFVLWLAAQGLLRPWAVPAQSYAIDLLAIFVALVGVWFFLNRGKSGQTSGGVGDGMLLGEQFDAQDFGGEPRGEAPVMRVSVMPSFGASPLVNADTGEHVSPAWLDIDYELAKRIERWDDTWQATFNAEDPGSSGFDDEAARKAYDDEGRAIVALLRAQWQGELVEVADQFR